MMEHAALLYALFAILTCIVLCLVVIVSLVVGPPASVSVQPRADKVCGHPLSSPRFAAGVACAFPDHGIVGNAEDHDGPHEEEDLEKGQQDVEADVNGAAEEVAISASSSTSAGSVGMPAPFARRTWVSTHTRDT